MSGLEGSIFLQSDAPESIVHTALSEVTSRLHRLCRYSFHQRQPEPFVKLLRRVQKGQPVGCGRCVWSKLVSDDVRLYLQALP